MHFTGVNNNGDVLLTGAVDTVDVHANFADVTNAGNTSFTGVMVIGGKQLAEAICQKGTECRLENMSASENGAFATPLSGSLPSRPIHGYRLMCSERIHVHHYFHYPHGICRILFNRQLLKPNPLA
jgi:hypothetical protein